MKDSSVKLLKVSDGLREMIETDKQMSWTMMYDEGFSINIGNLNLFHFNHYEKP